MPFEDVAPRNPLKDKITLLQFSTKVKGEKADPGSLDPVGS
jgi:hypothetical protein